MASILVPEKAIEVLEREAERRGLTPEAVLAGLLAKIAKPQERARLLVEAARISLEHARAAASEGKVGEAYRKLWSASILCLEACSSLIEAGEAESLKDYWELSSRCANEFPGSLEALYAGLTAYIAFRENLPGNRHVDAITEKIRSFVSLIEEKLESMETPSG